MTDTNLEKHPIFRIKPTGQTTAIIRHVGNINKDDKLGDEVVEVNKSNKCVNADNSISIKDIGEFEMVGRMYRCNIVGSHIVASARYPLIYLTINYDRPLVSGSLFQIFISIDVNNKKKVKHNSQYVGMQITGTWCRHIDCDDELTENYERLLDDMLENDALEILSGSNENKQTMSDEDIVHWTDQYKMTERTFYDELIKEQKIEFTGIERVRDYMLELTQSDKFYKFLCIAMKCREIQRRKKYGMSDCPSYVVPIQITKMNDIVRQLIADDEIIIDD